MLIGDMTKIDWASIYGRAHVPKEPEIVGDCPNTPPCPHPLWEHIKNGMCLAWLLERGVTCECVNGGHWCNGSTLWSPGQRDGGSIPLPATNLQMELGA